MGSVICIGLEEGGYDFVIKEIFHLDRDLVPPYSAVFDFATADDSGVALRDPLLGDEDLQCQMHPHFI